ncbi:MAG: AAA family ATPase [Bacteroidota bacterium]|nr:AAA family ATPase [Bacteroidota bacterium]
MAKKITESYFLTDVEIKNFKSIKHLKFKPKRVNLFIGKPNSGKSNLLEALSLLGETYNGYAGPFLESFIRFDSYSQLFFNLDQSSPIEIKTNLGNAWLRYLKGNNIHDLIIGISEEEYKKNVLSL